MQTVTALANDYHQRADTLIARSIEQTQRNDAATATMMEGIAQGQPADMANMANLAKQERAMVSTDIARADASCQCSIGCRNAQWRGQLSISSIPRAADPDGDRRRDQR